jgi:hypothetical protein
MYIYNGISANCSENEKCFRHKLQRKRKHTFYVQQLFSENRAVYEIMWKNMVQPDTPQKIIRRMRFVCWIIKATDTHSEYVILFLHDNAFANMPQCYVYMYMACLVFFYVLVQVASGFLSR